MTPEPYYNANGITLYCADCRDILPLLEPVDLVVTDPPYGETSLAWDVAPTDWLPDLSRLSSQLWSFASMRMVLAGAFRDWPGWSFAQDVVWEKHNGSGSASDRFKRVHEHLLHFYQGEWGRLHNEPPTTLDATARTVRRKQCPPHWGDIGQGAYASEDGGPRLQRSVVYCRSEHGRAIHETQKPVYVTGLAIANSCPPSGTVLDPFGGSCTTALAARDLGRKAIAIEVREDVCERVVRERLSQAAMVFT